MHAAEASPTSPADSTPTACPPHTALASGGRRRRAPSSLPQRAEAQGGRCIDRRGSRSLTPSLRIFRSESAQSILRICAVRLSTPRKSARQPSLPPVTPGLSCSRRLGTREWCWSWGPGRSGESTLTRAIATEDRPARILTLDDKTTRDSAIADPTAFIAGIDGPVLLDEVQRSPELLLRNQGSRRPRPHARPIPPHRVGERAHGTQGVRGPHRQDRNRPPLGLSPRPRSRGQTRTSSMHCSPPDPPKSPARRSAATPSSSARPRARICPRRHGFAAGADATGGSRTI